MEWMLMPYRRYADFSGRSRRKEYWMFILFTAIVYAVLATLLFAGGFRMSAATGEPSSGMLVWVAGGLFLLFVLVSFIPALAASVRRLHDQDKSGWFLLLQFIPYVGGIIIIVLMCIDGTKGENRFGPDPKGAQNLGDVFA